METPETHRPVDLQPIPLEPERAISGLPKTPPPLPPQASAAPPPIPVSAPAPVPVSPTAETPETPSPKPAPPAIEIPSSTYELSEPKTPATDAKENPPVRVKDIGGVLCGYRVAHCPYCGLDQPLEVYAFDVALLKDLKCNDEDKPVILERDLFHYVRPNGPFPDYDPAEDPDAKILNVCAFCRTASLAETMPGEVFAEWEPIDGWTVLAKLTDPLRKLDYNRRVSRQAVLRFLDYMDDFSLVRLLRNIAVGILFGGAGGLFLLNYFSIPEKAFLTASIITGILMVISIIFLILNLQDVHRDKPCISSLIHDMQGFALDCTMLDEQLRTGPLDKRHRRKLKLISQLAHAERKGTAKAREELAREN